MLDVIGKGAAQSWQMDNRGRTMAEGKFDFGFAVDWMRKDLGLVLAEAQRNGARLPVTALVDQFYADVQQMGGRRWDTSSLIKRLTPERLTPLPLYLLRKGGDDTIAAGRPLLGVPGFRPCQIQVLCPEERDLPMSKTKAGTCSGFCFQRQ